MKALPQFSKVQIKGLFDRYRVEILNKTYVVSLMHPKFLNVVEGFATLRAKTLVLVAVYFILKNAAFLEHLLYSFTFP